DMTPSVKDFAAIRTYNGIIEKFFFSGHSSDKNPAHAKHPTHLMHSLENDVIRQVLEHLRHDHHIELTVFERNLLGKPNSCFISQIEPAANCLYRLATGVDGVNVHTASEKYLLEPSPSDAN